MMPTEDVERAGFAWVKAVLSPDECTALGGRLHGASSGPGARELISQGWCAALADRLRRHPALSPAIGSDAVALQCLFFEKSAEHNWLVAVHQDLGFPVHERVAHPDWRAWSVKGGTPYVQPPVAVLEQLMAVRLHLDPCGPEDGPLWVVPGTHRQGIVAPQAAVELRPHELPCPAQPGDALLMRPLLLHRSSKATGQSRRRVLQFVFGPRHPPHGVRWRHTA